MVRLVWCLLGSDNAFHPYNAKNAENFPVVCELVLQF